MDSVIVRVHMGRIGVASAGETLQTILGSCVGIGLLWKDREVYGLAHCLLPQSSGEKAEEAEAKYVDRGVPELVRRMGIPPSELRAVKAVVAGGASMMRPGDAAPGGKVGEGNVRAARAALRKLGIRIISQECGDHFGRQMLIHGHTGEFEVQKIVRE